MSFPYLAKTVRYSPSLAKTVRIRRPPARSPAAPPEDPVLRYLADVTEIVPLPLFFALGMCMGVTGASLFVALIA